MKTYHILNGDALFHQLVKLEGEKIVFRECLIDGPIIGQELEEILLNRIDFFKEEYNVTAKDYKEKSLAELTTIKELEANTEVNLWFENDLFCQIHFWCCIQFLHNDANCFLVHPLGDSWTGFGNHSYSDLQSCLSQKKPIEISDKIQLRKLWEAFKASDWNAMRSAAQQLKNLIPIIEEVIEAHIDRFPLDDQLARPEKSLLRIKARLDNPSFNSLFKAFSQEEGIYGFGDSQVKRLIEKIDEK